MNKDRAFVVTHEFIEQGAFVKSWNKAQMRILGVPYPQPKGWKHRAVGMTISVEDAGRFLALRGQAKRGGRRKKTKTPRPRHTPSARDRLNALAEAVLHYLESVGVGGKYEAALREAVAEATGAGPCVPPGGVG